MADIELLKRLAEAATPGPWAYEAHGDTGEYGIGFLLDEDDQPVEGRQESGEMLVAEPVAPEVSGATNAAFIAAANPATVLALIAESERLRQIISDSATACDAAMSAECTVEFMGHLPAEITGVLGQIRAELERLRAERSAMASALMRIVDLSNSGHGPIRSYRQMLDIAAEARQVLSLEVANG